MDAFTAFIHLAGKIVVIAGTGEAAEAKARLFEGPPAPGSAAVTASAPSSPSPLRAAPRWPLP